MASLSAHLRQAGDHGRLGFHAECPVCREQRLLGTLSSESVLSRRAQAALATGALAVSFAAPSAVWAQESDSRQEGNVAPEEPSGGPEGDAPGGSGTPGFDPGGDTVLPFEAEAPQGAPGAGADDGEGESGPLETAPEIDPDARLVPPTESEATAPSPDDEAPVAPVPAPVPPAVEPSPPDTGAPEQRAPVQSEGTGKPDKPRRKPAEQKPVRPTPHTDAPATSAPLQTVEAVSPASSEGELAPVAQGEVESPALSPPPAGAPRVHVVRPGESLWSIARGLLGPDSSMARIAREVARLWELNEERIATGDPDLLRIGTRLRLR